MDIRQPWDAVPKARDVELTRISRCKKWDIIDFYVQQNSWGSINVTPYLKLYKLSW